MRLLNVQTLQLEIFLGDEVPAYAILSHTWGDDEITFQELLTGTAKMTTPPRPGWNKIRYSCMQANEDKLSYVWVDTCCIDKSSSSELSEAINSMFRWYRDSKVCYAYLEDVWVSSDLEVELSDLKKARWFTRGWTLQELIAPRKMKFYGRTWRPFGSKRDLVSDLSIITGIDQRVLRISNKLFSTSISERMSWASTRQTTRIEDIAYCLMGIFNVNMPLLYGEGESSFKRLQEEIIKNSTDHSIFAWEPTYPVDFLGYFSRNHTEKFRGALASHPREFSHARFGGGIIVHALKTEPFVVTSGGVQIKLPLFLFTGKSKRTLREGNLNGYQHGSNQIVGKWQYVGVLNCSKDLKNELGVLLSSVHGKDSDVFERDPEQPLLLVSPEELSNALSRTIHIRVAEEGDQSRDYIRLRSFPDDSRMRFRSAFLESKGSPPIRRNLDIGIPVSLDLPKMLYSYPGLVIEFNDHIGQEFIAIRVPGFNMRLIQLPVDPSLRHMFEPLDWLQVVRSDEFKLHARCKETMDPISYLTIDASDERIFGHSVISIDITYYDNKDSFSQETERKRRDIVSQGIRYKAENFLASISFPSSI